LYRRAALKNDPYLGGVAPWETKRLDPRVINYKGEWMFDGYPGSHTPKSEEKNSRTAPYWSLADLLGLFLTKLGPAPSDANAPNFFLPLIALYVLWTKILLKPSLGKVNQMDYADHPGKELDGEFPRSPITAKEPQMYQCTWATADGGTGGLAHFALGSSTSGYHKMLQWKRFWYDHTYKRFLLMNNLAIAQGIDKLLMEKQIKDGQGKTKTEHLPWTFENSIESHHFGNCAETYPFVRFLMLVELYNREIFLSIYPPSYATILSTSYFKLIQFFLHNTSLITNFLLLTGSLLGQKSLRAFLL
jgi:hypothetical protein